MLHAACLHETLLTINIKHEWKAKQYIKLHRPLKSSVFMPSFLCLSLQKKVHRQDDTFLYKPLNSWPRREHHIPPISFFWIWLHICSKLKHKGALYSILYHHLYPFWDTCYSTKDKSRILQSQPRKPHTHQVKYIYLGALFHIPDYHKEYHTRSSGWQHKRYLKIYILKLLLEKWFELGWNVCLYEVVQNNIWRHLVLLWLVMVRGWLRSTMTGNPP